MPYISEIVEIDSDLKEQFVAICEEANVSPDYVIELYMGECIKEHKILFAD